MKIHALLAIFFVFKKHLIKRNILIREKIKGNEHNETIET